MPTVDFTLDELEARVSRVVKDEFILFEPRIKKIVKLEIMEAEGRIKTEVKGYINTTSGELKAELKSEMKTGLVGMKQVVNQHSVEILELKARSV